MVSTVLPRADHSLSVDDEAFALSAVVGPLTIVDFTSLVVVHATLAASLVVLVVSVIHVACNGVAEQTEVVFTVSNPTAFIHRAVSIEHLALAFSGEVLVLTEVDVAVRIEDLSNGVHQVLIEVAFKDRAANKV